MSGKILHILFLIAVFFCCAVCLPVAAENTEHFSGGNGTVENPYQIHTPSDLMNLSWAVNNWADYGKYAGYAYVVTAPLDMSGISEWRPIGVPDYEFPTSNYSIFHFRGVFDGNYQPITGLGGTSRDGSGLFYFASGAVLKNIYLENVSVREEGVVLSSSQTLIENCSISGSVSGGSVGGLIGSGNSCKIVNCSVTGTVTGLDRAGGLAGVLRYTTVQDCVVVATVTSGRVVDDGKLVLDAWEGTGGLAGASVGCTVEDSFFSGNVASEGNFVGGLAGETSGDSYLRCGSTGYVEGGSCVGGLAGYSILTAFSDCFFAGDVHATESGCGGFIGKADPLASLIRCYAAGKNVSGQNFVGGVAGDMSYGTIEDCTIVYQSVTGSGNVSAIAARDDPDWPTTIRNLSLWEGMQVWEGDTLYNLSADADLLSSAEIWNVSPGIGKWGSFSAEIWKLSDSDGYQLPVLKKWGGKIATDDLSYLNPSVGVLRGTEASFPMVGLGIGVLISLFAFKRRR